MRRDESGFTLVEALITMVITAIVATAVGSATVTLIRNTDATNGRLAESHDAQITAAYFANDVQSVGVRTTADPPVVLQSIEQPTIPPAPPPTLYICGGYTLVVRFTWDEYSLDTASPPNEVKHRFIAAYSIASSPTIRQLHRVVCKDGTVVSDVVVAHQLAASGPTVTCYSGSVVSSCTTATLPSEVKMTVNITDPNDAAGYTFVVHGERRQTQ